MTVPGTDQKSWFVSPRQAATFKRKPPCFPFYLNQNVLDGATFTGFFYDSVIHFLSQKRATAIPVQISSGSVGILVFSFTLLGYSYSESDKDPR